MTNNGIPTAEEFVKNNITSSDKFDFNSKVELVKKFAKIHVEAALKAKDNCLNKYGMAVEGYDEAYPLENIK
jgi:hypothetical protein